MGNREEIKVGDEVEVISYHEGLLPGSKGVLKYRTESGSSVKITHGIWSNGIDKLWACGRPSLFPNNDGYRIPLKYLKKLNNDKATPNQISALLGSLLTDRKTIEIDSEYICTAMPWEIEKK